MKKRIVSIILATLLVITMIPALPLSVSAADNLTVTIDTGASVTLKDSDGDGYYEIRNADALYAFAAAVNSGNNKIKGELTADIVVNKNVLNADGTLNGDGSNFREWILIGYRNTLKDEKWFNGSFEGNSHTVSGLYFDNPEQDYVGLFGVINYRVNIRNIDVIDSYFRGGGYVGGIAGWNCGNITNCNNMSTIFGTDIVGGVAGSGDGTITNCSNKSTINGTTQVGGVVGKGAGTITNCHNTGDVIGTEKVGGVAGNTLGSPVIETCYNTGSVIGMQKVGGVVGLNINIIRNCYNTGVVKGNSYVGGVNGYNGGVRDLEGRAKIQYCYTANTVVGNRYVGGVSGHVESGSVKYCYYDSSICSYTGVGAHEGSVKNVEGKTTEQFASGEVAYLLGEAFGQSIDNGDPVQNYPVFGGARVFTADNCLGAFGGYSNSEDTIIHITSEKCRICECGADFHSYEETFRFDATCTAQGVVEYKCKDCGLEYNEILDALGHDFVGDYTDTTHTGECRRCDYVSTGFHNYSQTYTYETCTEDAYFTYTCDDCGYSYTRASTEKLGHTGGVATCKALAVCERCGEGYGEYADHIGGEATCTELAICDVCDEGYGELERHESESDDFDCTTPVYCSVCGAVTKEANATHTWDENNFCTNENCQETRGFTFTFKYGDEVLFVRNVHAGNFYTFEGFEERDGLTLVGWVADEDADEDGEQDFYPIGDYTYVEGDLSFEAVYKLVYTVRFITYDIWENKYVEFFNPITGEAGQTVTLWDDSSPYYKFLGWTLTEGGEVVYGANEEITLSEDLILYGVIRPYRATFDLLEGAVWNDENGNPITVLEGDYSGSWIEIHNNFPVRPGYIFKGFTDQTDPEWLWEPWQDEDTGDWILDFYFNMSDLTMTAVWEECTSHSYENGVCSLCKKPETQEDDILLGDINGDGAVNAMDTNLLKRVLAGVLTPDDETIAYADINRDGQINGLDSNLLSRIVSGAN